MALPLVKCDLSQGVPGRSGGFGGPVRQGPGSPTGTPRVPPLQYLIWAARLHEIGISIAHAGYHKHSAYVVQNADMPGFSKMEQARLALLVRAQRGALAKVPELGPNHADWPLIIALRLAVLFHRSRTGIRLPPMRLECADASCQLSIARQWLEQNPLTEAALLAESKEWKAVGLGFKLVAECRAAAPSASTSRGQERCSAFGSRPYGERR